MTASAPSIDVAGQCPGVGWLIRRSGTPPAARCGVVCTSRDAKRGSRWQGKRCLLARSLSARRAGRCEAFHRIELVCEA